MSIAQVKSTLRQLNYEEMIVFAGQLSAKWAALPGGGAYVMAQALSFVSKEPQPTQEITDGPTKR